MHLFYMQSSKDLQFDAFLQYPGIGIHLPDTHL
jgi:hypothetical protein